jgi:antitoxin ParD1/3/4
MMPSSYTLGPHYENFVQSQLESGRYSSASEVLRAGLRLLEERNEHLRALDRAIAHGIKDADAGRVFAAENVFDELEARYSRPHVKKHR